MKLDNRINKTCFTFFLLLMAACTSAAEPNTVTVRPADNGAQLENPGMGWMLYCNNGLNARFGGQLAPSDTVDDFPGITVIGFRIPWSLIEPQEGHFDWTLIDGPAKRWVDKGKQIYLRFMCCHSALRYATPEWVKNAGAKGYDFDPNKGAVQGGKCWEPDYNDPVFLEKLENFLAAAAARYDGSPEVAFIDIGSFGIWGEGHTYWSTRKIYPAELLYKHIDLHTKYFKHTLLVANDDFSLQPPKSQISPAAADSRDPLILNNSLDKQSSPAVDYAFTKGLTLRDDSILVNGGEKAYFHAGMAQPFWPTRPVILESEGYGGSRDRGAWEDGSAYLRAVEDYHASYVAIHWWPREFLAENRDLVRNINLRLGYRIVLLQASWPSQLKSGDAFTFTSLWRNAGVAPCLPGGYPAVTIKDNKGGIIAVFTDDKFDVRQLSVGTPSDSPALTSQADFHLSKSLTSGYGAETIEPGTYQLYISVGTKTGTPKLALPLPDSDGQKRYRLGTLKIIPTPQIIIKSN